MKTDEQKSSSNLNCLFTTNEPSSPEEDKGPNLKKAKVDTDTRNSLSAKESITTTGANLRFENTQCTAVIEDSKTETESEPEEGEITDSEEEDYSSEDEVTSEETVNSEDTDSEGESWVFTKYP